MTNVSVVPRARELGVTTDYGIYFTIENALPMGSSVDITFPRDYFSVDSLSAITCSGVSANVETPTCAFPIQTKIDPTTGLLVDRFNVLRLSGAILTSIEPNAELAFLLSGVTNPASSLDTETIAREFSIETVSPSGYPIDSSVDVKFEIGCVSPCATCKDERTQCLSCLRLDDGTPLFFLEE